VADFLEFIGGADAIGQLREQLRDLHARISTADEAHETYLPTDRLTTSSAQIFASLVFDRPIFTPSSPISTRAFSSSSPNQDIRF
jgi:hypothetical protein